MLGLDLQSTVRMRDLPIVCGRSVRLLYSTECSYLDAVNF